MRIVLLGPPGAGKGSLASLAQSRLGVTHMSTGELFRREIGRRSALGRRVQRYVTGGHLVPDALVIRVMAAQLTRGMLAGGFVLDGFPRTAAQAVALDGLLRRRQAPLDGAVYVTSSEPVLIKRLSGRRVCPKCGRNYHLRTMRPQRPGRCDRCGDRLIVRKDDEPRTIRKRLAVDRKAARLLVQYYRRRGLLHRVSGKGLIEAAFSRMVALFRRRGWL